MDVIIFFVFIVLVATFITALVSGSLKCAELLINFALFIVKLLGWLTAILLISWGILAVVLPLLT